jgi:FKBP-type peptidyl-prolyl cis-trans isomerase SlyD
MKIEKNTVVSLIYRLSDAQNNLIEESAEPMVYLHGGYAGTFPKIEEILEGEEIGFETQLQLEPQDAFGDYDAELLRIEQRDRFPEPLEIGMQFEGVPSTDDEEEGAEFLAAADEDQDTLIYTVTDIGEDRVVLDANHPFAGMALRFWIQVSDVRPATPEEVENGRAVDAMGLIPVVDDEDETDYEKLDELLSTPSSNHPTLH